MQNRKRDTDVQNRLLNSVGEGEGGMFQENSIKTCILSRVKQITSPGWMHITFIFNLQKNLKGVNAVDKASTLWFLSSAFLLPKYHNLGQEEP